MRKTFIALSAAALGFSLLAAPAQAAPEKPNHGQCVSQSPKPDGKGGRSEVAKEKGTCEDDSTGAPLECVVNGTVVRDSDADTVTVAGTGEGTPGSSLECETNIPVEEGDTLEFTYTLGENTDPCGGGVPRMFVVIEGMSGTFNTINSDPTCSEAEGNTVKYTLPAEATGTVTTVGLVYDRGDTGSVTYRDVSVGGETLNF